MQCIELTILMNLCMTNINRQIIATRKTIEKLKAEVMRERILEINPKADVIIHTCFFLPENADTFQFADYDYVVDDLFRIRTA